MQLGLVILCWSCVLGTNLGESFALGPGPQPLGAVGVSCLDDNLLSPNLLHLNWW